LVFEDPRGSDDNKRWLELGIKMTQLGQGDLNKAKGMRYLQ
jgi:hypothetical protein